MGIKLKIKDYEQSNDNFESYLPYFLLRPIYLNEIKYFLEIDKNTAGNYQKYFLNFGELRGKVESYSSLIEKLKDQFKAESSNKLKDYKDKLEKILSKIPDKDINYFDKQENMTDIIRIKEFMEEMDSLFLESIENETKAYKKRFSDLRDLKSEFNELITKENKVLEEIKLFEPESGNQNEVDLIENKKTKLNNELALLDNKYKEEGERFEKINKELNVLKQKKSELVESSRKEELNYDVTNSLYNIFLRLFEENKKKRIKEINDLMTGYFIQVTHKKEVFKSLKLRKM